MYTRISRVALVVLGIAGLLEGRAHAAPTDFSAGSLIIPMDVCYQPSVAFNGSSWSSTIPGSTFYATCPAQLTTPTRKDGIMKAYGLVYRLLQRGIPVYYILKPDKANVQATDMTITHTARPVQLLDKANNTSAEFMASGQTSIDYRGAPFIISAADAANVRNLLKTDATFTANDSRTGRGVFRDVHIHVAMTNILQAPVRAVLQQVPPTIALLNINNAAIGVLNGYLKDAGLYSATASKNYPQIGDIFTNFDNVSDFTTSNGLVAGGFKILWSVHWDGDNSTAADRDAVIDKIGQFLDAGNPVLAQCATLATFEGSNSSRYTSRGNTAAPGKGYFHTTAPVGTLGLESNKLHQSTWPDGNAGEGIVVNPNATLKAWLDPLTQVGDYKFWIDSTSAVLDFQPRSGVSFESYTNTYIQSTSNVSSENNLALETVAYKDGNTNKGRIIYLGGHSYSSESSDCTTSCTTFNQWNQIAMERLVLNTLVFLGQEPTMQERSRSAPIVFQDGKTYIGTYEQASQPVAAYPPWKGHFREYLANALSGTNVAAFNSPTGVNWDAAAKIAAQATADSRTIFTSYPVSGKLAKVAFTTATASQLGIASATVTSIRKGGLGGIDHSIPAIIQPSPIAGSSTRPTVAYVGGLDGMLHAILISGTAAGKSPGDELWAYIPNSQLTKVVAQTGGVDGSPLVGDAFIDTGSGIRSWRTLLAIPDGNYAGGTVDVLDITDPLNPGFLWAGSATNTIATKTHVMGRAQGAALAPIIAATGVKFGIFMATDNTTGNAGNGFNIYALNAENGSIIWQFNRKYPKNTTNNDVPGALTTIDTTGQNGTADRVYFGDIEGKVWSVSAVSGPPSNDPNVACAWPLCVYDAAVAYGAASSLNYPIESAVVLYRDPTTTNIALLGVTGGADWVPSSTLSKVFKYDTVLKTSGTLHTLGTGERAYAVPTIFGNSAYIITSVGALQGSIGTNFDATGYLTRINLGSAAGVTQLATVKQGAAEVGVNTTNGNVVAVSASGVTQNANSARDVSQATLGLQNSPLPRVTARAWLDFH